MSWVSCGRFRSVMDLSSNRIHPLRRNWLKSRMVVSGWRDRLGHFFPGERQENPQALGRGAAVSIFKRHQQPGQSDRDRLFDHIN